jgi:NAD(P)-dependent dehydrogenase (short-subunit alcohol dehydrogenase family)
MAGVAIITGYSSGLGRDLAALMLERDWTVVGVARGARPADLARQYDQTLVEVRGSVTDEAVVEQAFAEASARGGAEIVINCAGYGAYGPPGGYSATEISAVIGANLTGLILFSDAAVRHFGEAAGGASAGGDAGAGGDIVNVMSLASKFAYSEHSIYIAAKAGAKAYSRALRSDLQEQGRPIRVLEVYPCGMRTNFFAAASRAAADPMAFYKPEHFARHLIEQIIPRRLTFPQEITYSFDRSRPVEEAVEQVLA